MNETAEKNPTAGQSARGASDDRSIVEVICAFCAGKGRDPFEIMSPLSTCQVCGGTGRRMLRQPISHCAFCRGTGVHPGSRLNCTTCGGVGMIEIPVDAVACPRCGGSGRADYLFPNSPFACSYCGGKGVVPASFEKTNHSRE